MTNQLQYDIRPVTDENEVYLEFSGLVSTEGEIIITHCLPTDDGYELLTRRGEIQYMRDEDEVYMWAALGTDPVKIRLPDGFDEEFSEAVEELPRV